MNKPSAIDVSILIVSWNDWGKLQRCLLSATYTGKLNIEIIVIDNASADGSPEHVRASFPQVRLQTNSINLGHTKAMNQAFHLAYGQYVMVLDSDTVLLEDCITRLHAFLEMTPEAAAVAPRTFNTDGSIQESARAFPNALAGLFGRQSTLTRLFPNNPVSRRYLSRASLMATQPFEVDQIGGACMFFQRKLLDEVGYWDERYFGYWVDTDWCHQLRGAGHRIYCLPAARLQHDESNARGKRKSVSRIWVFHYGAWRLYSRWHTHGLWDPRSIFAGLALLGRACLMIGINCLPARDPLPTRQPYTSGSRQGQL